MRSGTGSEDGNHGAGGARAEKGVEGRIHFSHQSHLLPLTLQVGLPANDSNVRAAWRRVILTTPGLEDYVSGVILTEETLRQTQGAGLDPLASFLRTDSSGNAGHKGNGAGGGGASIGQHGSAEAHGGSAKAEGGGVGGSEGLVPPPSWTKWPLPFNLTSRKIRVGVKV